MKYKEKLAKIIRILTIAPMGALFLLTILYLVKKEDFGSFLSYVLSVIYLTLLPASAYPLQPYIPVFKDKGREGQRNLAIVMATVGYLCGIISITLLQGSLMLWVIYLTYFISGIVIVIFNKLLKIRASGHACGIVGPLALGIYFMGLGGLITGILVYVLVWWSSLMLKRHTISQLLWGSIIPLAALALAHILTVLL